MFQSTTRRRLTRRQALVLVAAVGMTALIGSTQTLAANAATADKSSAKDLKKQFPGNDHCKVNNEHPQDLNSNAVGTIAYTCDAVDGGVDIHGPTDSADSAAFGTLTGPIRVVCVWNKNGSDWFLTGPDKAPAAGKNGKLSSSSDTVYKPKDSSTKDVFYKYHGWGWLDSKDVLADDSTDKMVPCDKDLTVKTAAATATSGDTKKKPAASTSSSSSSSSGQFADKNYLPNGCKGKTDPNATYVPLSSKTPIKCNKWPAYGKQSAATPKPDVKPLPLAPPKPTNIIRSV